MWQNFHKISISLLVIFLALSVFFWPDKWALIFNKNSNVRIGELEELNKNLQDDKKLLNERYIILSDRFKIDSLKIDSLKNIMFLKGKNKDGKSIDIKSYVVSTAKTSIKKPQGTGTITSISPDFRIFFKQTP